jgi:hypothetical protein
MNTRKGVKAVRPIKRTMVSIIVAGILLLGVSGSVGCGAAQSGPWNGTILLTRTATATYDTDTTAEAEKHVDQLSETISITVKNGKAEATIDYLLNEHSTGIRSNEISEEETTIDRVTRGSGPTRNASIDVQFNDDGTYSLSFNAGGIEGTLDSTSTVEIKCRTEDPGCRSGVQSSKTSDKVSDLSGGAGEVTKPVGGTPNVLLGTANQPFDFGGAPQQGTIKWSLRR